MNRRILVVEDHEDTRAILRALLTHHGYEMIEVTTGEEMLDRIDEIDPALIILDVRLPGIDGCEALIRVRERGSEIPVYLFSEYYDLFTERVKSCRPDAFYPKSKGPVQLVDAIRKKLPLTPAAE